MLMSVDLSAQGHVSHESAQFDRTVITSGKSQCQCICIQNMPSYTYIFKVPDRSDRLDMNAGREHVMWT